MKKRLRIITVDGNKQHTHTNTYKLHTHKHTAKYSTNKQTHKQIKTHPHTQYKHSLQSTHIIVANQGGITGTVALTLLSPDTPPG